MELSRQDCVALRDSRAVVDFVLFMPLRRAVRDLAMVLALLLLSMDIFAQAPVDAGQLSKQLEQQHKEALPKPDLDPLDDPCAGNRYCAKIPKTPPPNVVTVEVSAFRFKGNSLLGDDVLAPVVAGYLHRPITLDDLKAAAAEVAQAYRNKGWIVQAYIPKQESDDATVIIEVIEAVFGKVRIESQAKTELSGETGTLPQEKPRVNPERLIAMTHAAQKPGQRLSARKLDRLLLLVDDLPGVTASGILTKGARDQETDLILKTANEDGLGGSVTLDNTGSRASGAERLAASVRVNSPLGIGDQAVSHLMASEGNRYGSLYYSLPVFDRGWRLTANVAQLSYELVDDDFGQLDARGTSSIVGVGANYPLIRTRGKNLYWSLNHQRKYLDNRVGSGVASHYAVFNLASSLDGNLVDRFGGGGINSATLSFTSGEVNINDDSRDGGYRHLRYSLARRQAINPELTGLLSLSGQLASETLDSSEKFYLGGNYGVRAYPTDEGGGSDGQVWTAELNWQMTQRLDVTGFYDQGRIHLNHHSSPQLNQYTLKGAGLSLNWQTDLGLNLKATWARRIGDNLNPNIEVIREAGQPERRIISDQDGSMELNRIWLQASMPF